MKIVNAFVAAFTCIALPCSAQVNKTWVADTLSAAASSRFWGTDVWKDGKTRSIYFEHNGNRVAFTPLAVWLETDTRMDAFPDSSRQIFSIVEAVMEGIAKQNEQIEQLRYRVTFQEQMLAFATKDYRKLLLKIQRYERAFGVLKD